MSATEEPRTPRRQRLAGVWAEMVFNIEDHSRQYPEGSERAMTQLMGMKEEGDAADVCDLMVWAPLESHVRTELGLLMATGALVLTLPGDAVIPELYVTNPTSLQALHRKLTTTSKQDDMRP